MGHCIFISYDTFYYGWVKLYSSLFKLIYYFNRITYSMGDVFLRPMMENLNTTRGPVSVIFGLLPAITLATGLFFQKKIKIFLRKNKTCFKGPIATIFTNTYGCRKVTIVGSCLAGVGFLLSYFFANIYFYYISIGIIGGKFFFLDFSSTIKITKQFLILRSWLWFNLFTCNSFSWFLF